MPYEEDDVLSVVEPRYSPCLFLMPRLSFSFSPSLLSHPEKALYLPTFSHLFDRQ